MKTTPKRITIITVLLMAISIGNVSAQNTTEAPAASAFTLRANILTWAVGSLGIGIAADLTPRWTLGIDGAYGNWDINRNSHAIRINTAGIEARRYFHAFSYNPGNTNTGRGCYLGADLRYTHFNHYFGEIGREGDLITTGVLFGYTFTLGHPRWSADASIGAGYIHRHYDRYTWYTPGNAFYRLGTRTRNGIGITNLSLSIAYRL